MRQLDGEQLAVGGTSSEETLGVRLEERNGELFHRYIASLGYLVVSFDNSGTPAPRGRAWRKAVYGAVGPL